MEKLKCILTSLLCLEERASDIQDRISYDKLCHHQTTLHKIFKGALFFIYIGL